MIPFHGSLWSVVSFFCEVLRNEVGNLLHRIRGR